MRKAWEWIRPVLEIAAIVLVILAVITVIRNTGAAEPDAVYPMTNQRIEWSGAGYNGFRRR